MERRVGFHGRKFFMSDVMIDLPEPESEAERRFQDLVKKRIAETRENPVAAEYAVALTPEGQAAWEEARRARLRRG